MDDPKELGVFEMELQGGADPMDWEALDGMSLCNPDGMNADGEAPMACGLSRGDCNPCPIV